MQSAINMIPSQLAHYNRHCLKDGCQGIITVTKVLGPHLIIETNMDIYDRIPIFQLKFMLKKQGKHKLILIKYQSYIN